MDVERLRYSAVFDMDSVFERKYEGVEELWTGNCEFDVRKGSGHRM